MDNRHRGAADSRHGNDYAVETMSVPRANGVLPNNRITITSNPLADADNKVRYILLFISLCFCFLDCNVIS